MILLIDIGNSRMKWAALVDGELSLHGSYQHRQGDGELAATWDELPRPDAVYCASVAAVELNDRLAQQVSQQWGLEVEWLKTSRQCDGVVNGYHQPHKLGVDRWAALIGAHHLCSGPVCVVDCGSAVTIDALDGSGQHLGGWIAPGLRMQRESLLSQTAGINERDTLASLNEWGRETAEGMQRGALESIAGLIERSRQKLQVQLGTAITVIITGGDAPQIIPLLDFSPQHEEHLVLQGMARMVSEQGE